MFVEVRLTHIALIIKSWHILSLLSNAIFHLITTGLTKNFFYVITITILNMPNLLLLLLFFFNQPSYGSLHLRLTNSSEDLGSGAPTKKDTDSHHLAT